MQHSIQVRDDGTTTPPTKRRRAEKEEVADHVMVDEEMEDVDHKSHAEDVVQGAAGKASVVGESRDQHAQEPSLSPPCRRSRTFR